MSFVKFSVNTRQDLEKLYAFLAQYDVEIAKRAKNTIVEELAILQVWPLSSSPIAGRPHVRKYVIDFGATDYLVFHKRYAAQHMNLVARIIHQKEGYDATTIGLVKEMVEESITG